MLFIQQHSLHSELQLSFCCSQNCWKVNFLIMIKSIMKLDKLTAVNSHWQKDKIKFKYKKRKHKAFNAETEKDSDSFMIEFDTKKKNEIVILLKKAVSKIFSSEWVADSEFFTYITDKLQLFSSFLIHIWCWQIKVEKKHLYSHYCEIAVIQDRFKNFVNLSSTLYVFKLKVNLLSEKQMCEMKLHRSFDQHTFYIWDKHNRIIIKVFKQDSVYIVKHIAKELNKFILLFILHTLYNLKVVFLINSQI